MWQQQGEFGTRHDGEIRLEGQVVPEKGNFFILRINATERWDINENVATESKRVDEMAPSVWNSL